MNEQERYLFDLNGYLVIEDVLSRQEVQAMRELLDARGYVSSTNDRIFLHSPDYMTFPESEFRNLINHGRLIPYLTELLGEGYRLDHEYLLTQLNGALFMPLHGGGTPFDPAQYYMFRNGTMHSGLTVASFALTDVGQGQGGFCCLPGSHKSRFPLPQLLIDFTDTRFSRTVPVRAGSVILFTEALTHGTNFYQGDDERKVLFFKYSPAHSSQTIPNRTEKFKKLLTPQQLERCRPPARRGIHPEWK